MSGIDSDFDPSNFEALGSQHTSSTTEPEEQDNAEEFSLLLDDKRLVTDEETDLLAPVDGWHQESHVPQSDHSSMVPPPSYEEATGASSYEEATGASSYEGANGAPSYEDATRDPPPYSMPPWAL